jgi:ribonuclease D
MHPILKTTQELEEYLKKLDESKIIFLDTEFKRKDTYHPILCLIQISINGDIALVDPLNAQCKLDPLTRVLMDDSILKVLHSARQDLEILYFYTKGKPIRPLFDTQIAAAFCGYGLTVSYENLVNEFLDVSLDKSQRITDWEKRPLTDKQIKYAINDVLYLPEVYSKLLQENLESRTLEYCKEEFAAIENSNFLKITQEKLLRKIKFDTKDPYKIAKLLRLLVWRENLALKLNLNRSKILDDEEIYLLAFKFSSKSMIEKFEPEIYQELHSILHHPISDDELNKVNKVIKKKFTQSFKFSRNLCRIIFELITNKISIARGIIANSDDINAFAQGEIGKSTPSQSKLLHGWRYKLVGAQLEDFFAGNQIIRIENCIASLHKKPK